MFIFSCCFCIVVNLGKFEVKAISDKCVFFFLNMLLAAIAVRFLTKRFIGEYDSSQGTMSFTVYILKKTFYPRILHHL